MTISIVLPSYNESKNVPLIYTSLQKELQAYNYEIIFIDDGSKDDTLQQIKALATKDSHVKYLSFSRNFGHQNALKAGLDFATGDCAISMDSDLQHPPYFIPALIAKWQEGNDVVYAYRDNTAEIGFLKRKTSALFYKIINFFTDTKVPENAADFRLLDRKVIDVIKDNKEYFLFLRGLISWVGFQQIGLPYKQENRIHGTTKYSLRKMISLAINGVTSISIKPLRFSIFLGLFTVLVSIIIAIEVLYEAIFTHKTVAGYPTIVLSIFFIGGIQLLMLGIIGEYLGKLFMENKKRPLYIVREQNITPS